MAALAIVLVTLGWKAAVIFGLVLLVLTMAVFAIDRRLNPYGGIWKGAKPRGNWDFKGKYERVVGGELGEGTFGIVVKVMRRDDPSRTVYAAKLSQHGFSDQQRESNILKHLKHPKITNMVDHFPGNYF